MPDGDYQSCKTCERYVSCSNGILFDDRPCANNRPGEKPLVWDDVKKRCEYESTTCPSNTPTTCVSNCSGMPDGDYQSCKTCEEYVSCSNGYYFDRSCPENRPGEKPLVWDDVKKRCEYESTTCPSDPSTTNPPQSSSPSPSTTVGTTGAPHTCVSDCSGVADGDYQSCKTCEGYVSCSNGYYFDRPCPDNRPGEKPLVWDDVKKRCEYESTTCPSDTATTSPPQSSSPSPSTTVGTTGAPHTCVSDCSGVADGDYQSCKACEGYVSCTNGYYFDRPCPDNLPGQKPLVWDDLKKRCEYESTTCPSTPSTTSPPQSSSPSPSTTVGTTGAPHTCVSDCSGVADGDYQSCKTCEGYVSCSNGYYFDRPCPDNRPGEKPLVWDDVKKRCEYESTTCPSDTATTSPPQSSSPSPSTTVGTTGAPHTCVSDCSGVADGDYQSCKTCEGYVSCTNGYYFDRPCPDNLPGQKPLVWDDLKKRCEYESTTCPSTPSTTSPPQSSSPSPSTTVGTTGAPHTCVSDCSGVADGDYQSCKTCEEYVSCSNGYYFDRPCPDNLPGQKPLVWDDLKKRCEYESTTCPSTPSTTSPPQSSSLSPSTTAGTTGAPHTCVSDCSGVADGDYQSCKTCEGYVSCTNGYYFDRPCPKNRPGEKPLVWDDEKKRCEYESTTCPSTSSTTSAPQSSSLSPSTTVGTTGAPHTCVSDCSGVADGDYQSCKTCEGYVSCSNGYYFDRPCPDNRPGEKPLVWDDEKKRCEYESTTCPSTSSTTSAPQSSSPSSSTTLGTTGAPHTCVSDCRYMPDGNYQSCKFCNGFVTCTNGWLCEHPCKTGPVWDDVKKYCVEESTTCPTTLPPVSSTTSPSTSGHPETPNPCVSDCKGMANGDYQSCKTCVGFVSCSNGRYFDMPCAPNHPGQKPLVWDDVKKRCEWTSSTCNIP